MTARKPTRDGIQTQLASARVGLLAALVMGASATLSAQPQPPSPAPYEGGFELEDADLRVRWSAWMDTDLATATSALRDWKRTSPEILSEEPALFEVRKSLSDSAVLYVEQEPFVFFLPRPKLLLDASLETDADRTTKLTWLLKEGTPEAFEKRWTLRPEAKGIRVTMTALIRMPVAPPRFVIGNGPAERLPGEVKRFAAIVGATRTAAKAPDGE